MEITDNMLCIAIDAHNKWRRDNLSKQEIEDGIDGFAAWRAALKAVFDSIENDDIQCKLCTFNLCAPESKATGVCIHCRRQQEIDTIRQNPNS